MKLQNKRKNERNLHKRMDQKRTEIPNQMELRNKLKKSRNQTKRSPRIWMNEIN